MLSPEKSSFSQVAVMAAEAESPYPLHECVFRGDVAALSALIRKHAAGAAGEEKARAMGAQGLNSIEFRQDVEQDFQQRTAHSLRLNALLKIPLNSLPKFN